MRLFVMMFMFGVLLLPAAEANLILTVNTNDGVWSADFVDNKVDVDYEPFFSQHLTLWLDAGLSGTAESSSSAMTYTGIFEGNAVSGAGSISLSTINDALYSLQLQFTSGLPASSGSFSAITITPNGNMSNPTAYDTASPGSVPASSPTGNDAGVLVLVPEPSSIALLGLGLLALRQRRR